MVKKCVSFVVKTVAALGSLWISASSPNWLPFATLSTSL